MAKEKIKLSQVLKRELKGRTLAAVAREVGISSSLLHDWTSASRNPSGKNIPELRKLARHLGLTLEEILFDESNDSRTLISSTTFTDSGRQYKISIEKLKQK